MIYDNEYFCSFIYILLIHKAMTFFVVEKQLQFVAMTIFQKLLRIRLYSLVDVLSHFLESHC